MRSVISAIWTSAEPVSRSALPNFCTSSCLRSAVTVMRRARLAELSRQLARSRDVAVDLLDQRLDRCKQPLAPQPREEVDAQLGPVEVLVVVDEMRLDQDPAAGLEHRPHADVDRGRDAVGEAGVDALVGPDQALVGHDVGSREAELAPAAVAV